MHPIPNDGRLHRRALGVAFAREPGLLVRLFGPDGEPLPTVEETAEHARVLQGIGRRLAEEAETERRRAETERLRAEALAEENDRLRAELDRLRQSRGESPGPLSG